MRGRDIPHGLSVPSDDGMPGAGWSGPPDERQAPGQSAQRHPGNGTAKQLSAPDSAHLTQRRAFGATRRVADQLRPALTVEVWESPAVGAASPISLGST